MEDETVHPVQWWEHAEVIPPVVCNVSPVTREFVSSSVADPSPLEPGVWLIPAHSYLTQPPEFIPGYTAVALPDGSGWSHIVDLRGSTVYCTETGEPQTWEALGELPGGLTLQAPESAFDTWQDDRWVLDRPAHTAALQRTASKKKHLLNQYATALIDTLLDAVEMKIAQESELAALKAWKVYRVELSRVDTTSSTPATTGWPVSPDETAMLAWLTAQGFEASD